MNSLYDINKVMDEFLEEIEIIEKDIILKSSLAVVSISSLLWLVVSK